MVSSKSKKWLFAGGALLLLYFLMGRAGGLGLFSGWPGGTGREEEEEDPYAYEDYSAWADRNKVLLDPNLLGGQSESGLPTEPAGPSEVSPFIGPQVPEYIPPRPYSTPASPPLYPGEPTQTQPDFFENIQRTIARTLNIRREAVEPLEAATGMVAGGLLGLRLLRRFERGGGGAVEAGKSIARKFGGGAGEVAERTAARTALREGKSLISRIAGTAGRTGIREITEGGILGLGRRVLRYIPRLAKTAGKGLVFGIPGAVIATVFGPEVTAAAGGPELKAPAGGVKSILLSEKPIVTPESKTQVKSGLITGAERTMARLARTETLPEVRL
ncbi:hypothetical protein DRP07_01290 [Archaeoglobales archaeon]|nr:MAG: hypothetical protein DRP07_01290 [Archaeoglobales archaeon]